ncbi:MAG: chromate efflux transporter [Phycisphaerales bacterium]|nr:chromate efflux transporter [Phycisphaerales bacterium]
MMEHGKTTETPGEGPLTSRLLEVVVVFLKLGLTCFGGPVAHLGYYHTEFVRRRGWVTEEQFVDLVALSQFLPGPASSQVVFGVGMKRAGSIGGVVALTSFMLPSAIIMVAFAFGLARWENLGSAGWVHGLKVAAVAVVAAAVLSMWRKLCPDGTRSLVCLAAAAALLLLPGHWSQVSVILSSAVLGWVLFRHQADVAAPDGDDPKGGRRIAVACLVAFALLLIALPMLARSTGSRTLAVLDSFYRSGSLIFGGGHVLLPLLRTEVVPHGWVSDDAFLAGYGAAQAIPGPLFTFAGYLGVLIFAGPRAWLGAIGCLFAIFLPACLLVRGAIPFWHRLRSKAWAQAGMRGANAGVVGVLLAALYNPVITEGISGAADVVIAVVAFGMLLTNRISVIVIVAMCAAAGQVTG